MKIAQKDNGWQPITLTLETPQEAHMLRSLMGNLSVYQDEHVFRAPGMSGIYGFLQDALEGHEDELPRVVVNVEASPA